MIDSRFPTHDSRLMSTTIRPLSIPALFGLAFLAGCQTTPTRVPEPPQPLQLVSSSPLRIQDSCEVEGAVLVEYTVLESGETGNIEVSDAPSCARDALTAWVSSHRYTRQPEDTSTRFEWILVSGKRGS
jgi:hypothetical protein